MRHAYFQQPLEKRGVFISKPILAEKVRLLICDLDGTLYPGLNQRRLGSLFLERLLQELDPDRKAALLAALHSFIPSVKEIQRRGGRAYGNLCTGELFAPDCGNLGTDQLSVLEDPSVIVKLACTATGIDWQFADKVHSEAKIGMLRASGIIQPGVNDSIYDLMQLFMAIPKVIATNSPLANAESVLQLLGVAEAFSKIYASCRKPFGLMEVLEGSLARRNLEPGDALYIGDSYGLEIEIARSFGIPSVYISQYPNRRELVMLSPRDDESAAPLVVVPNLNAVAEYLKH